MEYADFITFGGNDLTQSTYGLSRDDAEGKYLAYYTDYKILPENPFLVLDEEGVGELIRMATEGGRSRKPKLKVGICGAQSSGKSSVQFFHRLNLDFLSCIPQLIPIARLAAAQASILEDQEKDQPH